MMFVTDFGGQSHVFHGHETGTVGELLETVLNRSQRAFHLCAQPSNYAFSVDFPLSKVPLFQYYAVKISNFDAFWDGLSPERKIRSELACCYRLFHEWAWDDTIYGHLTARLPPPHPTTHILINAFGLLYSEISASNLVVIDAADGRIVDGGSTMGARASINKAGYVIHSALHESRLDVACVMHCHEPNAVAVSCLESGVDQTLTQSIHIVGSVGYHAYEGIAIREEERKRLVAAAESTDRFAVLLQNHGPVTMGRSVGEALLYMHLLVRACETQIKAYSAACKPQATPSPASAASIIHPDNDIAHRSWEIARGFVPEGVGNREMKAFVREMASRDPSFLF
eukprot:ANDGO_02864.mRNA.1 Putative aldolase class 2 protein PA3430